MAKKPIAPPKDLSAEQMLRRDLEALCDAHGLTSVAVSATFHGNFFGVFVGPQSSVQLFTAVCGVGRLWQYARELMRDKLNSYEIVNGVNNNGGK